VRLAESRGERLGIGFQQRGYTTRVAVPFDAQLADGLETTYQICAEACPTGALAIRKKLPEERS
jgi:ferredoxin